jgi:hypothetical protein
MCMLRKTDGTRNGRLLTKQERASKFAFEEQKKETEL